MERIGTFIGVGLIFCVGFDALCSEPQIPWSQLDAPHPYCERQISLDVGADYFFPIVNDLPGQREYNDLVALYRRKDWSALDPAIEVFQKTFEKSPLREAAVFLSAESHLDRVAKPDDEAEKVAEKTMREALLLYPKSTLAPVLCAAAGNFWLRMGKFERGLSIYQTGLSAYPDHKLNCVFKMGVAESSFLLHDWSAADDSLRDLVQGCKNFRLRTAATLRQVESLWLQDKPGVELAYEKVLESDSGYVERFYQTALYNLGEIKYRLGKLSEAKFYFTHYLQNEKKDGTCVAGALKRLADIAWRSQEPVNSVAGKYLAVQEAEPSSDLGRFSYGHALLLTLNQVKKPEFDRRIRIIDEEAEKIKDQGLRTRLYLEKGLACLGWGQRDALDFLEHVKTVSHVNLDSGAIGNYIHAEIRKLTEADFKSPEPPDREKLASFENHYRDWLKGTSEEKWARSLYQRKMLAEFRKLLKNRDRRAAFALLDHWKKTALWDEAGPNDEIRYQVADGILNDLIQLSDETGSSQEAAAFYVKNADSIQTYLTGDLTFVSAFAAFQSGDPGRLQALWEGKKGSRELASLPPRLPSRTQSLIWFAYGQAQRKQKNFSIAQAALARVHDSEFLSAKLGELSTVFREEGKYERAYELSAKRLSLLPALDKPGALIEMKYLVIDGKLWNKGKQLLTLSQKSGLKGKSLAPFLFLAGRSSFERSNCGEAIQNYQTARSLDPEAAETAEARFRLGKCLVKQKRLEAARDEFDKLIKMQDTFWSPLARNEMKLLSH